MKKQRTIQLFYLFVIILLLGSCITEKQANTPEMYAKRKAFIENNGEPANQLFDRSRPAIFR